MSTGRSQHSPNVITAVDNVITERRVITPHDYTYLSLTQWDSIRVENFNFAAAQWVVVKATTRGAIPLRE